MLVSYCNINCIHDTEIQQYLSLLPHFMAVEINKYRLISDRKSRLLSRLMLLKYLREEGKEYLINNWQRDDNYKPYIAGWKSFNFAHSGDIAACCFSTMQVGLDIEEKLPIDFSQITSQFRVEEEDYILRSDNTLERFYEIWVKKEAVLKAAGLGIVNGLKDICCLQEEVLFENKTWYLTKLYLSEGYTSFLCSPEFAIQPAVVEFDPGELMPLR